MAGINEDRNRQIVPLWRKFEVTSGRGELASHREVRESRFSDEMLKELVEDWRSTPGPSVAADFVSVALTLGRFGLANDAATFLLSSKGTSLAAREVASVYLRRTTAPVVPTLSAGAVATGSITDRLRSEVRQAKKQLISYPNNPILWTDLARVYTALGVRNKAMEAMQVALAMAPENRYVLRAAARFYLHQGMRDRAHRLLMNSASVQCDPWVMASEIGVAAAIGRTSGNIRGARKLLAARGWDAFHLSELASAVGTLESLSGNLRAARLLISQSLERPAENSIAQAAWLHRNVGNVGVERGSTSSIEANAWYSMRQAKWDEAVEAARCWQAEQPFSSRPAITGSHLTAVVLDDQAESIEFSRLGLLGNPDDFTLRNNLAFSLASSGKNDEAREAFRHINTAGLPNGQRIVYLATTGLIAYRAGDTASGRRNYEAAIRLGQHLRDNRAAIAQIYLAMEELRAGAPGGEALRREAIEASASLTEPWQQALLDRLKRFRISPVSRHG